MEAITVALITVVGAAIVALVEKGRRENKTDHGVVSTNLTLSPKASEGLLTALKTLAFVPKANLTNTSTTTPRVMSDGREETSKANSQSDQTGSKRPCCIWFINDVHRFKERAKQMPQVRYSYRQGHGQIQGECAFLFRNVC